MMLKKRLKKQLRTSKVCYSFNLFWLQNFVFLEKAAELKEDVVAAAQTVGEKAQEVAHEIQGNCFSSNKFLIR